MEAPEDDEPWWPEEDDDWSENSYYETVADHFRERYERVRRWLDSDCN